MNKGTEDKTIITKIAEACLHFGWVCNSAKYEYWKQVVIGRFFLTNKQFVGSIDLRFHIIS